MPMLLRPQQIARTADFKIAHGDSETGSKLGKFTNGAEALFCLFREHFVWTYGEISIGLTVASANASSQLIKLAETEPICVKDNQRVCTGHVQTAFDNGCTEKHVIIAAVKVHHHVF